MGFIDLATPCVDKPETDSNKVALRQVDRELRGWQRTVSKILVPLDFFFFFCQTEEASFGYCAAEWCAH